MKQPLLHINKPQPPLIIEKLFSRVFWRIPQEQKTVYLTFDDGPVPIYTPWVLDVLDTYKVPATFFCVGENAQTYPDIFSEIQKRGHAIGSHTYNHLNGWKTANALYFENVCKAAQVVESKLFRPPYGKITLKQARVLSEKLTIIMWDVLSKDYDQTIDGETCFDNIKNYVSNGSIIVFHDSPKAFKNLEYALPKTIEWLQNEGYKCAKLHVD